MRLKTLDLHRTKHVDVEEMVCKFLNWTEAPCRIITGNSTKMKEIVKKIVDKYGYTCYDESVVNNGSLIVVEPFTVNME